MKPKPCYCTGWEAAVLLTQGSAAPATGMLLMLVQHRALDTSSTHGTVPSCAWYLRAHRHQHLNCCHRPLGHSSVTPSKPGFPKSLCLREPALPRGTAPCPCATARGLAPGRTQFPSGRMEAQLDRGAIRTGRVPGLSWEQLELLASGWMVPPPALPLGNEGQPDEIAWARVSLLHHQLQQSRLNSGPKIVTLHKPAGFKLMTRDRWEFHGKEIFLHKAAVAHRHLKPVDFQLVVFSQSNLQDRKRIHSMKRHLCASERCPHPGTRVHLTNSCLF